jgi:NAD(P) transhydrogenase subunit alpha
MGLLNLPGRLATDATSLYARNLLNFLTPLIEKGGKSLKIDWDDEIVKGTCLTKNGVVVHSAVQG